MLCHGFQRSAAGSFGVGRDIPGLVSTCYNEYVASLKSTTWQRIFDLLGAHADRIVVDLLVNGAMFAPLNMVSDSIYQLSGIVLNFPMHMMVRLTRGYRCTTVGADAVAEPHGREERETHMCED